MSSYYLMALSTEVGAGVRHLRHRDKRNIPTNSFDKKRQRPESTPVAWNLPWFVASPFDLEHVKRSLARLRRAAALLDSLTIPSARKDK